MRNALSFIFRRAEDILGFLLFAAVIVFPLLDIVTRLSGTGISGSSQYIQHIVLWLTFVGGLMATRERHHLSLAIGADRFSSKQKVWVQTLIAIVCVAVMATCTKASLDLVRAEMASSEQIGIFRKWWVELCMPVGFALMALRFVFWAPPRWYLRLAAIGGIGVATLCGIALGSAHWFLWFCLGGLVVAGVFGTPIFVVLAGIAALLFLQEGVPLAAMPAESYRMIIKPSILAIPLFTLAGFILTESRASSRLVGFFQSFFGWMRGGPVIAATLVCAFFTTFTGASGVTILALGPLLFEVLVKNRYSPDFSRGLLTSSGSIGLLFPPSVPIIIFVVVYNSVAASGGIVTQNQLSMNDMFLAGIIPGLLMVATLAAFGVVRSFTDKTVTTPFSVPTAVRSALRSSGELLFPAVILIGIFGGFATFTEAAALMVLYVIILESVIHRDIPFKKLPQIFGRCAAMIGGVLVIIVSAVMLTSYIVDAQIAESVTAWCTSTIKSPLVFLLMLNLILLVVGCFMDIFSATLVVVPLIIPLGAAFGISPIHLGIIFLANMELGYLTPPVGLNLFLAAYRFDQPLLKILKSVLPFFFALLAIVLIITYVPAISLWLPGVFGR